VPQVAHGRHEPVGERRHVPHAGALDRRQHVLGLGDRQRERLLAQHVASASGRGDDDVAVARLGVATMTASTGAP
jgi:hypothetical protein